ncbi:MAG TPA: histidine kinase [Blastococcus sp.]|nr:histidine kinase [Blastococcus sp.]
MSRAGVHAVLVVALVMTGVAAWVSVDDAAGAPEFLFGTVVVLCLVAVLRLAVRAAVDAVTERARATRLASMAEAEVARQAVAVERARLTADVQAVIRSAALAMGESAEEAARRWDDDPAPALHAVEEQGERAGVELRRLLGLLREAGEAAVQPVASPGSGRRISRADMVLAAAVTVLAVAEVVAYRGERPPGQEFGALSALLTGAAAATIVLRRMAPDVGAASCGLLFLAGLPTPGLASGFWLIACPGTLAWASIASRGLSGLAATAVLGAGIAAEMSARDPDNLGFTLALIGVAAVGGGAVRASERWGRAARGRADRRAAELDAAAENAVRAERLTVARELHDVVSHAVGVTVVQAGAALATRGSDPARARRALDLVRRTAADTLQELDKLVEVLEQGGLGAPAPVGHGPDELTALIERMRAGGLVVRADVDAAPSGEIGAVVYRVVQESLTNVVRHAPCASATVHVRADDAGVTVEVADEGPGPAHRSRSGYGLVGIDERVRRLGGELVAGPSPSGAGFRVQARIPARAASQT